MLDKNTGTCYNGFTSVEEGFFVVPFGTRAYSFGARRFRREGGTAADAADGHLPEKQTGGADMRVKITLACSECKQRNYETKKNKKNDPDRLEMNKYCRFCNKHTLHKETK